MNPTVRLRVMTEADLAVADSLRALAGWNQTLNDWRRLLAYEPDGCFIAEWNGAPVGTATTTRYGSEVAWIGMLLVHPDHRGRGIGKALLEHCLNHLGGTQCVKLDATPLGKKLYDKLGFQEEWPLTRWECKSAKVRASLLANDASRFALHASVAITPWDGVMTPQIERLDSSVFGVSRARMLERLAADSFEALVCKSTNGDPSGYGLLRRGSKASYLGPVVANSPDAGTDLIQTLLLHANGQPIYWDVPDANSAAVSRVRELGFVSQRHLLRMFIGQNAHPGNPMNYYALAEPAIG